MTVTYIKNLAAEYASSNLAPMLEFRNHNGIYDMKINNKWYYFNPITKGKYNASYDEIFYHITTYFKVLSNMVDNEENNSYKTQKEEIKDIYKRADAKFINLIAKQIFEYVKKNVQNTALNNSNEDIPLPLELTDMIYQFVPNDTDMDLVNKIKNKIMLPKNEIIVELLKIFPHIENEPEIIEIYCKYVELYSTEKMLNLLKNKLCDEYHEKKSFPKNNDGKFLPISKNDFKILKKYVYLDNAKFTNLQVLMTSINGSMQVWLYTKIKKICNMKKFKKYDYVKTELQCFGEFREIEIYKKIIAFGYQNRFYKNGWKSEIPELLSNTTNMLTCHDIYMIKQYPIWIKTFLEDFNNYI
jgi:hypothetical protein